MHPEASRSHLCVWHLELSQTGSNDRDLIFSLSLLSLRDKTQCPWIQLLQKPLALKIGRKLVIAQAGKVKWSEEANSLPSREVKDHPHILLDAELLAAIYSCKYMEISENPLFGLKKYALLKIHPFGDRGEKRSCNISDGICNTQCSYHSGTDQP